MDKKAHLSGIGFALVFGFSFMFSKMALANVVPIGLIAYRFLLAFLVFEVLRLFKVVKISINRKNIVPLMLVALFQPVLYFIFETFGLTMISSGEAGMMIALIPIFVSIFSAVFLKEKPRPVQIGFILLSVFGILFIQFARGGTELSGTWIGFLFLFFAVISAALFNIASRSASRTLKPHEVTYFMMLSGAAVFNIIYVIQLLFEHRIVDYVTNFADIRIIVPVLYLGIVASIGGFFLVNYTLGKLPAHVSSIYSNLSTIVAVIAGAVFLSEPLHYYHYLGGAMIVIGVYGTVRTGSHAIRSRIATFKR